AGEIIKVLQEPDGDRPQTGTPMDQILRLLRSEYGIEFAYYKPTTVVRRIERRLALTNQPDVEEYARSLARSPDELNALYRDVHRVSLDVASAGCYEEESLEAVTPARRDRYFSRDGHRWRMSKELRQLIVFARHNLITDAPFTRLDLITCRNLLIYFQPAVQ